ncbi:hypothetical protein PMIN02_012802 [Paraphaeosphaeria minitans]
MRAKQPNAYPPTYPPSLPSLLTQVPTYHPQRGRIDRHTTHDASEAKRSLMSVCHRSTAPKKAIHAEQKHCWVPGSAFEMVPTCFLPRQGLGIVQLARARRGWCLSTPTPTPSRVACPCVVAERVWMDRHSKDQASSLPTVPTYHRPTSARSRPLDYLPTHPSSLAPIGGTLRYDTVGNHRPPPTSVNPRPDQTPPPTKRNPSHPMMDPRDATPTHLRPTRSRRSHYSSVRALGSRQTSYR